MVYFVAYISTASNDWAKEDLKILLEKSRAKNTEKGISGLLLYEDRDFIQILEGKKEVVMKLFEKISQDQRHCNVIKLFEGESPNRQFPDWSMGFYALEKQLDGSLKGFKNLKRNDLFSPSLEEKKHPVWILIQSFYDNIPIYKRIAWASH